MQLFLVTSIIGGLTRQVLLLSPSTQSRIGLELFWRMQVVAESSFPYIYIVRYSTRDEDLMLRDKAKHIAWISYGKNTSMFAASRSSLVYLMTVFLHTASLVGQSAPPEVMQKLTYLVLRHPKVKRIDTVRAYTFGVLYFVEVSYMVCYTIWHVK